MTGVFIIVSYLLITISLLYPTNVIANQTSQRDVKQLYSNINLIESNQLSQQINKLQIVFLERLNVLSSSISELKFNSNNMSQSITDLDRKMNQRFSVVDQKFTNIDHDFQQME